MGIEIDCLKPKAGSGTIFESAPNHLPRDIDIFQLHNIIAKVKVVPMRGEKWSIPEHPSLKEKFLRVLRLNRMEFAKLTMV